jgi:hypothetical protein
MDPPGHGGDRCAELGRAARQSGYEQSFVWIGTRCFLRKERDLRRHATTTCSRSASWRVATHVLELTLATERLRTCWGPFFRQCPGARHVCYPHRRRALGRSNAIRTARGPSKTGLSKALNTCRPCKRGSHGPIGSSARLAKHLSPYTGRNGTDYTGFDTSPTEIGRNCPAQGAKTRVARARRDARQQ